MPINRRYEGFQDRFAPGGKTANPTTDPTRDAGLRLHQRGPSAWTPRVWAITPEDAALFVAGDEDVAPAKPRVVRPGRWRKLGQLDRDLLERGAA